MKVILINPRLSKKIRVKIYPPIGLGYLASYLENAGHKVRIVDSLVMNYDMDDIKKELKQFDPDVVGVTATTPYIYEALLIVKIAKENNPNCMTVLGGPDPTFRAKEILKESPYVDVIVRGEGEITFTELLEKKKKEDLFTVDGISFRLDGRIIENKNRKFIEDLDSLPFPAHHLLPKYDSYPLFLNLRIKGQPYTSISTCRGCTFDCAFCSSCVLWGRRWRARSPENVVEELKLLRYKYGLKVIDFVADDTFTVDKKRVLRICELIIEEGLDISWECEARVDLFDRDIAIALKKAGCYLVQFGIESGVQKTLDFLNKGFRAEDAERAVKIAKNAGLKAGSNFMIGVPGETKEMINTTIFFAKKLDLDVTSFTILVPLPGSKIYKIAEENNLLLTKDWSKYNLSNIVMKVPGLTSRELKGFLIKAYLICNLNPFKIITKS